MEKYQNSKYIFVVGIGGSDLASKAVWNAMTLHRPAFAKASAGKEIFFLESPDAREYEEIENIVKDEIKNLEEVVLIAISKSGKTAETLESFNKSFNILSKKFVDIAQRTIIISTKDTPLWKTAEEKEIEKMEWPENVGGRFSAFTIPHITVLSIAGLNAHEFVAGGKEMAEKSEKKTENNQALYLAKNIYDNYKKGINILDFFIFNSELEDLGKWCRQLIAESLAMITPTVSVGPVDLHSMLELYLGGPKNRFTIFIRSLREIENSINETAYENVTSAYEKANLPFEKIDMPEINEYELGKFMALMMATTIELAKLLEVNPYDQPAVEEYKRNIIS
jgi:glucose-6-phosphate isomerase